MVGCLTVNWPLKYSWLYQKPTQTIWPIWKVLLYVGGTQVRDQPVHARNATTCLRNCGREHLRQRAWSQTSKQKKERERKRERGKEAAGRAPVSLRREPGSREPAVDCRSVGRRGSPTSVEISRQIKQCGARKARLSTARNRRCPAEGASLHRGALCPETETTVLQSSTL